MEKIISRQVQAVSILVFALLLGCASEEKTQLENLEHPSINDRIEPTKLLSKFVDEYSLVAEVLTLNETQVAAISKTHEQFKLRLEKWHATDGLTMRQIQQQALDAARTRDFAALKKLKASGGKETVAQLHAAEKAIQKEYEAALLMAIPSQKLDHWKAYRISDCLIKYLEPISPTEAQLAEIRRMAPRAIESVSGKANWQGYGTRKLEDMFASEILDANQQQAFDQLQSRNRLRMLKWNN